MNEPMHIDAELWRRFLAGEVRGDERARIAAHLETPCEHCEDVLAAMNVDVLDGATDDALMSIADRAPETVDEVGFRRVERALKTRRVLIGSLTAAAAVILALILLPPREPRETLKGGAATATIHLELLRAHDRAVELLAPESRVEAGTTIVFRITLSEPGCIELWKEQTSRSDLLDAPACFPAGAHVLESNGAPLGLTLKDPGEVTIGAAIPGGAAERVRVLVEPRTKEVP